LRESPYTLTRSPRLDPVQDILLSGALGIFLSQNELDDLEEGSYEVVIDLSSKPGNLEPMQSARSPEESSDEVLVSFTSVILRFATDNLSGIA